MKIIPVETKRCVVKLDGKKGAEEQGGIGRDCRECGKNSPRC